MVSDNAIGDYLRARREGVRPADIGISPGQRARRVPGLRREEVARLAGISPEYYLRLEQGRERHPSSQVISGIARALALDEAAEDYLRRLVQQIPPRGNTHPLSASLERFIDGLDSPAFVHDRILDVLVANSLATALLPAMSAGANVMRAAFLDPTVAELYLDWEEMTERLVLYLRAQAVVPTPDPRLAAFVEELSALSPRFTQLWSRHDVRPVSAGVNKLLHPRVGRLDLHFERFCYAGTSDPVIVIYHAEPGTPSARALEQLAHPVSVDS